MGAKSAGDLVSIVTHSSSFETIDRFFTGRSSHLKETPKRYHVFELPKKGDSLGKMYFAIRPSQLQQGRWNSAIFWQSPSAGNAVSEIEKYCKSLPPELEEANKIGIPSYMLFAGGCAAIMAGVAGYLVYSAVDSFIKATPETKLTLGIGYSIAAALGGLGIWTAVKLTKMDIHTSKDVPEGFRKRLEGEEAVRAAVSYVTSQIR